MTLGSGGVAHCVPCIPLTAIDMCFSLPQWSNLDPSCCMMDPVEVIICAVGTVHIISLQVFLACRMIYPGSFAKVDNNQKITNENSNRIQNSLNNSNLSVEIVDWRQTYRNEEVMDVFFNT